MANEALFVQGGSYDAAELRKLISGIYTAPSPGGIIDGLEVTAGVGASVTISSGHCYVDDSSGGAYMGTKSSSTSLALTGFTGSPRTDRIYARVLDPGSGSTAGELEINKAQGSTTIPALSIPLADVTVNATGVSISTSPRVAATVHGTEGLEDDARAWATSWAPRYGVLQNFKFSNSNNVQFTHTGQIQIVEQALATGANAVLVTLTGHLTIPATSALYGTPYVTGLPMAVGGWRSGVVLGSASYATPSVPGTIYQEGPLVTRNAYSTPGGMGVGISVSYLSSVAGEGYRSQYRSPNVSTIETSSYDINCSYIAHRGTYQIQYQ
jgi:hypothetical protein